MNIISKKFILSIDKIITRDGCWLTVSKYTNNHISFHGKNHSLHRVVAYLWYGGFDLFRPNDATICHKCNNDTTKEFVCFNPEHVYVGTDSSNMIDAAKLKTHVQSRKTHCPNGHLYNEVAKRQGKITERRCSTCRRNATRKWRSCKIVQKTNS